MSKQLHGHLQTQNITIILKKTNKEIKIVNPLSSEIKCFKKFNIFKFNFVYEKNLK